MSCIIRLVASVEHSVTVEWVDQFIWIFKSCQRPSLDPSGGEKCRPNRSVSITSWRNPSLLRPLPWRRRRRIITNQRIFTSRRLQRRRQPQRLISSNWIVTGWSKCNIRPKFTTRASRRPPGRCQRRRRRTFGRRLSICILSTIGQRPFGIRMDTIGLSATVNDALDSSVVGPFEMERSSLKDN